MMKKKYSDDEEEDENLQEAEYHKKSDYSQAELVREAVSKIKESRGKEMKSGYWNILTMPNGSIKKEYIGDSRKEYIGSIEYLKSLLNNEIATSKKAKSSMKEFKKRKKRCFDNFSVNATIIQNGKVITLKQKYIPEVDEFIAIEKGYYNSKTYKKRIDIERIKGLHNNLVKIYWDEMVLTYDYLFRKLNNLIAEKNYFKQQATY